MGLFTSMKRLRFRRRRRRRKYNDTDVNDENDVRKEECSKDAIQQMNARKETYSSSMSSVIKRDSTHDELDCVSSSNSSTWDDSAFQNRKNPTPAAERSLSGASMLRLLMQQKRQEKQQSAQQQQRQRDDDDCTEVSTDEPPLFLRQKPTRQLNLYSNAVSSLHPVNYTQNNHVLINYERQKRNLHPLKRNIHLDAYAREHARSMAEQQLVIHSVTTIQQLQDRLRPIPVCPTSSSSSDAATSTTQSPPPTTATSTMFHVAENVLRGESVQAMHKETMAHSHADKRNMLSTLMYEFGMGTAVDADGKLYLCQLFRSIPTTSTIREQ